MLASFMLLHVVGCFVIQSLELPVNFRPPAIPLVVHDPYTSVWSFNDTLTEQWSYHWTGKPRTMAGLLMIDGKLYRFMGPPDIGGEPILQKLCQVLPTRTIYQFEGAGIALQLTFTTPMLTQSFLYLTAPITFVEFELTSTDAQTHKVVIYFDVGTDWCVDNEKQVVQCERKTSPKGLTLLKAGTVEQPILEKAGDNRRIDWGYLYLAIPEKEEGKTVIGERKAVLNSWTKAGVLSEKNSNITPQEVGENPVALAFSLSMEVSRQTKQSNCIVIGYDDIYSIEFMHEKLRPAYWENYKGNFDKLLDDFYEKYPELKKKCEEWDQFLIGESTKCFGPEYAQLIGLTYRHVFGSGKIVIGPDSTPWFFHKECFSNGCIATVDVSYPASPFFALFAPTLLRGMLEPVFRFAKSPEWTFDFAPHDVGTYPKANGQVYGKEKGQFVLESQMPVEECGNMILMTALYRHIRGDVGFVLEHWECLERWANYLKEHGRDPENQLCTDDFAGHLAHNTNLSLKAIVAIGAFAKMCKQRQLANATEWEQLAKDMAQDWIERAKDNDHFRLTFDRPDTWSMKYNLVWDVILGLNLFPPEVAKMEMEYYKKKQNQYGLPLDCRKDYTKTDWLVWCATMTQSKEDFLDLFLPFYRFMNETPDRIPLTDWYDTKTGKCVGFRARPVIGGVYIPFLYRHELWKNIAEKENQ